MKIGIFGGHFDPFTTAHLAIAQKVIDDGIVDRVLVVPSIVEYYRETKDYWLSARDRCTAISRILHGIGNDNIVLDDREVKDLGHIGSPRARESYVKSRRFIHTLTDIMSVGYDACHDEYYTIIGSDQFANFKSWFCWDQILKISKLVVVQGRDFGDVDSAIPHIEVRIDSKYARMSATKIRKAYKSKTMDEYISDFKSGKIEEMNWDDDPRFDNTQESLNEGPVPGCEEKYDEKVLQGNGEELIAHTPIFDLVRKGEVQPGFRPVGINSPDWVTVIVKAQGKFLMVRQLRYGTMTECTEFPCGMVEEGESPREAATRELSEETGWDISPEEMISLGVLAANNAFMNNHMYYFYADLAATNDCKTVKPNHDEHERLQIIWQDCIPAKEKITLDGNSSSLMAGAVLLLNQHGL